MDYTVEIRIYAIFWKNISMNMIKRFSLSVALTALLLCYNLAVADEIQDANKLFKQGQQAQALEKLDAILASKPKDAQARFLKGLIFTEQGKTAEAIKIFTGLTEDYPDLPEPYNNIAVLYAGQGQYEKAKVELEMAIRTHPSYATAHENLGDIYAKMASQAYDRALQLDKSNTSTATKLEMIKDLFSSNSHRASSASHTVVSSTGTASAPDATVLANASAVVSAKPVIATAEPTKPATAEPAQNTSEVVLKTVHDWAKAWSSKNAKQYLAFYASDFKTPDGEDRSAWEQQRQARIAAPKSIQVGVSNAKVTLTDENHASVNFRQTYQASHLHTSSNKVLLLVKSNDKWLIAEEHAGK
jgi:tetratricopeptide (TPR) repeat protein